MSFVPIPCPPASGQGGGGADVEQLLLCDVFNGEVVGTALAVYEYDEEGNPAGPPIFIDPTTGDPYVAQGTLQPCPEGSVAEFILCDVQTDNSSVQFIRKLIQGPTGAILEIQDQLIDGSVYVPTGTVQSCDPYTLCTPGSDLDLNAECGPGEAVDQTIVADDQTSPLANSVFEDDPSADPLCGGQWNNPAAALPVGFPVNETFRNATFDQPGPVLQGNGPGYPLLTADPANNGLGNPAIATDAAGAGWLRTSDLTSGTNGLWQVPTAFSTAQGMTASITHASHDGTTPGGDGAAFVFTNGGVAPQAIPVGGFGNLGLQNWQGGYVAVVLDEFGQTCSCSQAAQGNIDPNAGPCGFCANTISIQLAGSLRTGASCACCTIASMPLNPNFVNQTTRAQPLRLHVSIIEEGGQTFVSAGIDWNDGNGVVQYFDRVNVTACAGPAPATLRMAAYGGSGGAFRAVKEFRDATARPAGSSQWRAFPITTDTIPECVTLLNIEASVDVTFNSDTQPAGNGDPEAYFWLVNEATNTVVARAQRSSNPAQVGTPATLTVNASVPPGDLPNLRLYVGSESRDQNGEYDTLWENLDVNINGTGCPAPQRRTIEISARCPIPVTCVNCGEGGGGGTTVVNTPSTFEDAAVCMTIGGVTVSGFRREVRSPDGNVEVSFLGQDGLGVTPDSWFAGSCISRDAEPVVMCDQGQGLTFIRTFVYDENGEITSTVDTDELGGPFVPVGPIQIGPCTVSTADRERICYVLSSTGNAATHLGWARHDDSIPNTPQTPNGIAFFDDLGNFIDPTADGFTQVECSRPLEQEILCDDNGPFLRVYTYSEGGAFTGFRNLDLGGSVYNVVGTVHVCPIDVEMLPPEFEFEEEVLCDDNGPFFRRTTFNTQTQTYGPVQDFTLAGAPYVTVGTVGTCQDDPVFQHQEVLCDDDAGDVTQFIRKYIEDVDGNVTSVVDLDFEGNPYVIQGVVGACSGSSFSRVLCDDNGEFVRVFFYDTAGELVGFTDQLIVSGAPYTPVGAIITCSPVDNEILVLCDDNGPFLREFRWFEAGGRFSSIGNFTLARTAYVPVGTVTTCDSAGVAVSTVCFLDNNGVRFTRVYVYTDDSGIPTTVANIDANGAAFVPAVPVVPCDTRVLQDTEQEILCDANGDRFVRKYSWGNVNAGNGPIGVNDFDLDGNPFVAVDPVAPCEDCCPINIGDGCWDDGADTGQWTAIRNADGTIVLIDPVTGLTVDPNDVVECPDESVTIQAQHRLIGDADVPWSVANDVPTGTLTSVTFTVLSGTATVTDQNGTVAAGLPAGLSATWSTESDSNTLDAPTSIDAVGGNTYVNWNVRP